MLFSCIIAIFPAEAEEYPQNFDFRGYYKARFSGILIGKVGAHFSQNNAIYSATADITSSGVLKLFTEHASRTQTDAKGKAYRYTSIRYIANYRTKKKKKYVEVKYKNGKFASEKLVPPENPQKRPPVPLEMRDNSVDPLSAVVLLRSRLRDALNGGKKKFSIPVYDGRRLTTALFTVGGLKVIELNDKKYPVIEVTARRQLTAGFRKGELEEYDPSEPELKLYFINNADLFPARLELSIYTGTLQIDLERRCTQEQSCLLNQPI